MKQQFRPTTLTIYPIQEEEIYMKPLTPQDQSGNKLVTPYAVVRIVNNIGMSNDTPVSPVTPVTPCTPDLNDKVYNQEKKQYYFYHPQHAIMKPVKDSAPTEAPPPPPNAVKLVAVYAMPLPLKEEDNIYANNIECIALITDLFSYLDSYL